MQQKSINFTKMQWLIRITCVILIISRSTSERSNEQSFHAIFQEIILGIGNNTLSNEEFDYFLKRINDRNTRYDPSDLCKGENLDDQLAYKCRRFTSKCLGGEELIGLQNDSSVVNAEKIQSLCPFILYQAQSDSCLKSEDVESEVLSKKPTAKEIWGYGFLFVTIISFCSLCGIAILPLISKDLFNKILTYLIGLAVGSLASSAVFHLIPQTFQITSSGNHDYLWNALVIIAGIMLFFFTERVMKIAMKHNQRKNKRKFVSSQDDKESVALSSNQNVDVYSNNSKEPLENSKHDNADNCDAKDQISVIEPHSLCHHDHDVMFKETGGQTIAAVAYMIIFGDGLHNFIDGLSIGAAFSENVMAGISISVAIICEEFPHELGDLAVLLNAGMTMKQALFYNFMSACSCYLGLIIGILLGELEEASIYIFAIAAGMFLYISLVDMVPEMNHSAEVASKISVKEGLKVLFIQSLGIFTGVLALFVLALYTEEIQFQ